MVDSVFRLAIFAVVAGVIIYIIIGLFSQPSIGNDQLFRKGLDYAEGTLGNSYSQDIVLTNGSAFSASRLDSATRSVRFECSSTDTCYSGKLQIGPRLMKVISDSSFAAHFRCVHKETLNDCTIYFGEAPAQLELGEIEMEQTVSQGQSSQVLLDVANKGNLEAVDSHFVLEIYSQEENEAGKQILMQKVSGEIERVAAGETKKISAIFTPAYPGAFVAKVTVFGEDAGSSTKEKSFIVADSVSSSCAAGMKENTTLEGGMCRTQYSCSGCEFGAECKIRWMANGLSESEIVESYPTGVYTQAQPVNGECQ